MIAELQAKRRRAIKRIALFSWLFLIFIYGLGNEASGLEVPDAPPPVTLETVMTLHGEQDEGFWLAHLSAADDTSPDALGVAWVPVSAGWFGDVWTLQLAGSDDVMATRTTEGGTGILSGFQTVRIATEPPQPGHEYRVILTYDPASGAFGTRVVDETNGNVVVEYAEQLAPYAGELSGHAGYGLNEAFGTVTAAEQTERFVPIGLSWRLVTLDQQRFMNPVRVADRREDVFVHTRQPWDESSGGLRLTLQDETGVLETVTVDTVEDNGLAPFPLAHLPAGDYVVVAEYVTGDEYVVLGSADLKIGMLFHEFTDVQVHLDEDDVIHVAGEVAVWADGPVEDAVIGVDAFLDRIVLQPERYENRLTMQPKEELTVRIVEQREGYVDEEKIIIPFTTVLTPQSETAWPYRIWNVRLETTTQSIVATENTLFEDSVRIYTDEQPQRADNTLRIMTYNIQHGRGMDDVLDLQRIADVIAYADVDIVGLQEVDVRTTRSLGVHQAEQIAEYIGMEFVFGGNLYYRGGEYGNAILSRYPITSWSNERLPLTKDEARGLLHVVVEANGNTFTLFTTHLSLHQDENALQREFISERLSTVDGPFAIIGDFNVQPNDIGGTAHMIGNHVRDAWQEAIDLSPAGDDLRRIGRLGHTFSSAQPDRRIDYVFLSPGVVLEDQRAVFIIDTLASDHVPIVAQVTIEEDEQ